jgi:hypothetical protein
MAATALTARNSTRSLTRCFKIRRRQQGDTGGVDGRERGGETLEGDRRPAMPITLANRLTGTPPSLCR